VYVKGSQKERYIYTHTNRERRKEEYETMTCMYDCGFIYKFLG